MMVILILVLGIARLELRVYRHCLFPPVQRYQQEQEQELFLVQQEQVVEVEEAVEEVVLSSFW